MNKLLLLIYFLQTISLEGMEFVQLTEWEADLKRVNIVLFSIDGSYLVSGGDDGTIKVWGGERFNKIIVLNGHKNGVNTLSFSSDGNYLASGGNDNKIKLWRTSDWKEVELFESNGGVKSVIFSSDTLHLIAGNEKGELEICDMFSKKKKVIRAHKGSINSLSQNKAFLISGGADRIIKIWEPITLREVTTLKGFRDFINSIFISPDGKFLVVGIKNAIEIWNLDNFSKTKALTMRGGVISTVRFSLDGKYLFAANEPCFGGAGYIRVWKRDNYQLLYRKRFPYGISSFDFFLSKNLFVTANGKKLTVFRIKF